MSSPAEWIMSDSEEKGFEMRSQSQFNVDHQEMVEAARLLIGGGVTELRALEVKAGSERWPKTWCGYFDCADKLAEAATAIRSAKGIYIVANGVAPALLARAANRLKPAGKGDATQDGDIPRRRWLPVDCDPRRPAGISASDAEHNAALERAREIADHLQARGWPEPIAADSGNGAHLLYRVDLPTDDAGIIERCLRALAGRYDDGAVTVDTTVHNPARIWKLYGTMACKGDNTQDRPWRMSRIIRQPDLLQTVPDELLQALADEARDAAAESPRPAPRAMDAAYDVAAFIGRHGLDADGPAEWNGRQGRGRRWTLRTSPLCDHHDGAAHIEQHSSGAVTAGCHHASCSWTWQDLRERHEPREERRPKRTSSDNAPQAKRRGKFATVGSPILTCLADVAPRPVSWLWPGRIPAGRITLLVGRPGEGKSFLTTDAAARVSTGTPWPDGSDCPRGSVILISAEDDPADTIRPRLDAHYADVSRVHLLSGVRWESSDGTSDRIVTLADVEPIRAALEQHRDCRLIVVDPIGSYLGATTDAHRDNEVRGVLAPIAMLAENYGPAVLVVAHRRKSAGGSADDTALGSRAFTGIARAVWHVSRDAQAPQRRLLLPGKNNLAREGEGLAFTILGEPPRISWEREPVAMSADEALAAEASKKPGPEADILEGALAWLRAALAEGPRPTKELQDEWASQAGSERTLQRAKQALAVESYRPDIPGPWWWRLPKNAKTAQLGYLGGVGDVAKNMGRTRDSGIEQSKDAKIAILHDIAGDSSEWGEL